MKTKIYTTLALILGIAATSQLFAQAPGGVSSGLSIWLKADAGTSSSTNGALLTSWNDQSGNGVNATQSDPSSTPRPRFVTNAMNGNPAIEFNGGGRFFNINYSSLGSDYTIITVVERFDANTLRYVVGVQSTTPRGMHLGYSSNTNLRFGENAAAANADVTVSGYNASTETPCVVMGEYPSVNSRTVTEIKNAVTSSTTDNDVTSSPGMSNGVIGRGFGAQGINGYVAEVIAYNRQLSSSEKANIYTYLSIKYGFSIAVADHDYYGHTSYSHDIFGIGNNTAQGLNQTSSQSENSDAMIQISNPSSLGDGDYLICGNDNGSTSFSAYGGSSCAITNIMGRRWKAEETGEVGTFNFRFDVTGLTPSPSDMLLIIDQDGDGYDDETPIEGTYSAPYLTFTGVSINNGAEFTLGEGTTAWYSRGSGNTTDAIWSKSPSGSPQAITSFCSRTSIIIQAGHSITNNALITARNFTIENTASFDQGSTTITLHGTYLNSGTHTITTGSVNFNGTASQAITGTTITEFHNVNCNNASGVSISGTGMTVKGILQVNSGTFSTNNKLTLASYSSSTGSIGPLSGGDVIGDVTILRNHTALSAGWVNICAPVSGEIVSDWNDDIVTSGFTGSDFPNYSFNNVQYYNETLTGNRNQGYVGVASISEGLAAGRGYFIYMNAGNLNLDVTGPIYKNAQSLPVTFTNTGNAAADGWCLVGNPYPSSIDWDASGWTKTNMANAVYVYDASIGQFASYINGVGTNGGSGIIPSTQSFFVQANGASPALTAAESVKTSTNGTFKNLRSNNMIKLAINNAGRKDETVITFDDIASTGFEFDTDAQKLKSPLENAPYLCSVSTDGFDLAINGFPSDKEEFIIPLKIESNLGGKAQITWSGNVIEDGYTFYFEDMLEKKQVDMASTQSMNVDLIPDNNEARFQIRKTRNAEVTIEDQTENITGYLSTGGVILNFNYNEAYNFKINAYNVLGQQLIEPIVGTYSNQTIQFGDSRYAQNALIDIINTDTGERTTIRLGN